MARITPLVAFSDTDTAWDILEQLAAQDIDDAVLAVTVTTACFDMCDRQRGTSLLTTVMGRATPHPGRETADYCAWPFPAHATWSSSSAPKMLSPGTWWVDTRSAIVGPSDTRKNGVTAVTPD
jgi:hypothetical protein